MTDENPQAGAETGLQFSILRIYIKDVSFETPNSPAIFIQQEFKPEVNVQLNSMVNRLKDENLYEVVLIVTATSKHGDKTAFLVEVQQAGIFQIQGFDDAQKGHMLGAFCPETLYPFAREVVADLVTKGGFPPLLLSPVNFDAFYQQQQQNRVKVQGESAESGPA